MNKGKGLETDKDDDALKKSVEFLTNELIESYIIINRLNGRCNFLSLKVMELEEKQKTFCINEEG